MVQYVYTLYCLSVCVGGGKDEDTGEKKWESVKSALYEPAEFMLGILTGPWRAKWLSTGEECDLKEFKNAQRRPDKLLEKQRILDSNKMNKQYKL